MALVLRPVNGLADVEYNLQLLAQALANISGDQIVPGTLPAAAINGEFMPVTGGGFSGAISAPSASVAGAFSAGSGSFTTSLLLGGTPVALAGASYTKAESDGRYYTQSQVDTLLASKAGASNVYTKAEADALLADKAGTATGTTTTAGLLKQASTVAALSMTVDATYNQTQVQTIGNKVDAVIAALKAAGQMAA